MATNQLMGVDGDDYIEDAGQVDIVRGDVGDSRESRTNPAVGERMKKLAEQLRKQFRSE